MKPEKVIRKTPQNFKVMSLSWWRSGCFFRCRKLFFCRVNFVKHHETLGFKLPLEIYTSGSLSRPNPGWRNAHVHPFKRKDHSKHLITAADLTRMPLHCGRALTYILELAKQLSFWITAVGHCIPKPCSLFALQPEIQSVQKNSSACFAVFIFKYLSWLEESWVFSSSQ